MSRKSEGLWYIATQIFGLHLAMFLKQLLRTLNSAPSRSNFKKVGARRKIKFIERVSSDPISIYEWFFETFG